MKAIITQPGLPAHVHPDDAARQRRDRLARASSEQMERARAFLSVIDPIAFGLAMTAVPKTADEPPEDDPIPLCRQCGALAGIFLDRSPRWQHYTGGDSTSATQEIYDPGHPVELAWILPDEDPADL